MDRKKIAIGREEGIIIKIIQTARVYNASDDEIIGQLMKEWRLMN